MRLTGKRAVLTGAGGGIGRATALKFAAEGAAVICADLTESALSETDRTLKDAGAAYKLVTGDLADPSACEALFAQAAAAFGGLDILFNNAGIVHADDTGPIETPLAAWDKTISINLTAVFLACKYALPHLLKSGKAAIINNASIVALVGSAYPQIAYTAAKGGVLSMTREIAIMYARQGLRANAICPGPVATPLVTAFLADEAAWNLRRPYMPMGRLGAPEEIANVVTFLASDEASYVNAATYTIDGGITAAYVIDDTGATG
jgi:NAD(P)-dependent dehydrogenase (short-subunit alcohol dehydrogenase family)